MKKDGRLLLVILLLLFFIINSHEVNQAVFNVLHKEYVNNTDAICNDGTAATFFIGGGSTEKWIVYFESGGLCASNVECNIRYLNENSTMLMTSKLMPEQVKGRDILSADVEKNPVFHDYTRVLVPYCSSDLWLGAKRNPRRFDFVNSSDVDNFSFSGHTIFRSLIQDLIRRFGLTLADELVLSGSSAGAIGVLNHAEWILNHVTSLRKAPFKLSALLDSGWFINFQESVQSRFNAKTFELANNSSPACSDIIYGFPCCVSASCMLTRGYFPATVPVFFVFSMYDLYMYTNTLKRLQHEGKTAKTQPADFVSSVSMYGGAMYESLTEVEFRLENMSYFVPACFQHIYLCTSSLWENGGPLKHRNEITQGTLKFKHVIKPGSWITTEILAQGQTTSIQKAVSLWMTEKQGVRLIDTCQGALCNPSCPDELLFVDRAVNWGDMANSVIIGFSLLFTVMCASLKMHAMIHYMVGQRRQRRYLEDMESTQGKEEEFVCRTKEAISIACLSLGYSVDAMEGIGKAKHGERDLSDAGKDASCSNPDVSHVTSHRNRGMTTGSDKDSIASPERSSLIYTKDDDAVSVFIEEDGSEEDDPLTLSRDLLHLNHEEQTDTWTQVPNRIGQRNAQDPANNHLSQNAEDISLSSNAEGIANGSFRVGTKISLDGTSDKADASFPTLRKKGKGKHWKHIIHDVSVYFNPGELVAVMGPSGSGKTTLLDMLTGRRKDQGKRKGKIFVNGSKLEEVEDWYSKKVGYVLQLATPYYEELTVRQNLTFAAQMRLPKEMSTQRKYERVELIIGETGLSSLADTVVGGAVGPGLSGGQKRRLCVALQMINMPLVMLLDEPTSGLDASSSLELLKLLNMVAESGRLVILTIHQPRLEIFYLFHKILFLCKGKVAYYGEPTVAPKVFLEAYMLGTTRRFQQSEDAPKMVTQNPADTIIDILGCKEGRQAILEYYQGSGEPEAIQEAISVYIQKPDKPPGTLKGKDSEQVDAGIFNRLYVLENRVAVGQTTGQILYFPLIFFVFGLLIGSAYWRAQDKGGVLLMSAYCVYSCASTLFLSAILIVQLNKALQIFQLEHADRVAHSYENLIQTYSRTATLCVLPVIVCSAASYFMLMTTYDLWQFLVITVISLVLNQTWIAFYTMVICANPRIAHRICPMVSATAGFAGAFLVPMPQMPAGFVWLFYINPQFYGYSAIAKVLLQDLSIKCVYNSTLNCFGSDGNAVLARFGFSEINPYSHLVIMLAISLVSLCLAWIFLEVRYTDVASCLKRRARMFSVKTDGDEPSDAVPTPTWKRRRGHIKRTPSTRSTLRLVNGGRGEHAVLDTTKRNAGNERKRPLTRRNSSQVIYERKLAFYKQLSQMVGVVRRMSEVSPPNSPGLQMAPSVPCIAEEQGLEGEEEPTSYEQRNRKRWSSDRVPKTRGADEVFCTKQLAPQSAVDGSFDGIMNSRPLKVRSRSEPPRKNCREVPVDKRDGKDLNSQPGRIVPEIKPPSLRTRKMSIVDDSVMENLDLSEGHSAAPKSSEVNSITCDSDPTEYHEPLADALAQSNAEYSDGNELDSFQSLLDSQQDTLETTL